MRWPFQIQKSNHGSILLSVVIVVYNMQREGYRTLFSLSNIYQKDINSEDYEVIVIDNGSDAPFHFNHKGLISQYSCFYLNSATPSPAGALNFGISKARGRYIGLMIDGARMVTPGLLHWATKALKLEQNPLVCVPGLHLGPAHQGISTQKGYSKEIENQLLDHIDWKNSGYDLFGISCWSGSSKGGWLSNIAESNCIFLERSRCINMGGFDEAFKMPGGGFVNLDFYKRASTADGVNVIYIQGEGCFHQLHGGVTTGGNKNRQLAEELHNEYRDIRGTDYTVPAIPFALFGHAPPQSIAATLSGCQHILGKQNTDFHGNIHNWLQTIGLSEISVKYSKPICDLPNHCEGEVILHIPAEYRRGQFRGNEIESIDSAVNNIKAIAALTERINWSELNILDYGCGVKFTQALIQYDVDVKAYVGMDVFKEMIQCLNDGVNQSNFHFYDVPFKNEMYNPNGIVLTAESKLPGSIKAFDLITLQSVFTHFNPVDFKAMLYVLRRYAACDARMLFTCFIDNEMKCDFLDSIPGRPLLKAYYKEHYIREILEETRWKPLSLNPPNAHMQHHFICEPY